jgi:hypothetical protein
VRCMLRVWSSGRKKIFRYALESVRNAYDQLYQTNIESRQINRLQGRLLRL